jgi:hypothetical protein
VKTVVPGGVQMFFLDSTNMINMILYEELLSTENRLQ